jgi:hypothetical protein
MIFRRKLETHPSTSAHRNNLNVDILMPNREITRKSLVSYRNGGFKGQAIIKILFAITLNSDRVGLGVKNFVVYHQGYLITLNSAFVTV